MGFLHRSFRRSISLSGPPLDFPFFLFCLFFPRTVSLRQFAYIHASLFSPIASSVPCPRGLNPFLFLMMETSWTRSLGDNSLRIPWAILSQEERKDKSCVIITS